jgi:hypothetical protein
VEQDHRRPGPDLVVLDDTRRNVDAAHAASLEQSL